jgi:hypothetical protein
VLWWVQRNRRAVVVALFVFAVLAFSGAWTRGALVLDGPGISLYVRLVLDHLGAGRTVPYWMPELWTGAPLWAVTPTLPIFLLVPLGTALGPDVAVKAGVLAMQVAGGCGTYVLARSLWKHGPASIVAGVLFALQHVSLAARQGLVAGAIALTALTLMAIPYRMLTGWIWNRTGSLLVLGFLHAAGNAATTGSGFTYGFLRELYPDDLATAGSMHLFAFAIVGMVVLVATRGRLGLRRPAQSSEEEK